MNFMITDKPQYKIEIEESGLTQKQWYAKTYLRSEHWKQLRNQKFSEVGKRCEVCGKTTTIEVHHLSYREIYDVLTSDLQVLCKKHHGEQHENKKPIRKKKRRQSRLSRGEQKQEKAARKAAKIERKRKRKQDHRKRLAARQDMRFNMVTFADEAEVAASGDSLGGNGSEVVCCVFMALCSPTPTAP